MERPWRHSGDSDSSVDQQAAVDTGAPLEARTKNPGEAQTVEELGEADVEGLAARGRRITTASCVAEVWTALQIDQPPLLLRMKESARERTERLFNVRLGEPDPRLFAPLDAPSSPPGLFRFAVGER